MQLNLKGADVKTYFLPSNLAAIRGLFNIYLTFIRKVLNRYAFYVINFFLRIIIILLNCQFLQ